MAADWSRSETISSPDEIVIEYSTTNAQGQSEKKEVVLISTPRSLNTVYHAPVTYTDAEGKQQTREVITRKVDEKRTTVAAVNPAYIVWRLSQGLGLPVGDVFNITETTYEYVVSTEGPRVVREQVSDYMTEWQLAGSLAIEKYNNYEPTADRFECNRTVTLYDEWTGPNGRAVTRRRISRWASLGLSQEGSQAVQRKLKSIKSFLSAAQDLTGANLEAVVNSSKRLIFEGTEVQIETGKLPVPEMPSAADRVADEIVNGSDTTDTNGNGIPDWAQYDPSDPFDVDNNGDGISDWVDLESLYEPDDNERRTNNDFTFDDQVSQQALDFDPATGLPIDPISGLPAKAIGSFQVDSSGRLINPATGQPYNPPITVAIDPVTGRPIDTGLGLLINPATGDIFNPPRFARVDPDSGLPIFAGDSVTATYEMPFAPDDTIEFVDGVRTLVPGGSEDAAELFGEVEAALDYGHAYGQNIVTAFGEMPTLTLAPIYIQLAGVEGAFLMDSVTYAWGSDGMVVSSDLMLLGVTGRYGNTTPSASWLRVPVPVASLRQINTAGTIEASPQKANTIAIPGGFDARNPAATLAALPTNGTDVFREWRDGDQLAQPVIKIKRNRLFTKPILKVGEFSYSLIPSSESAVLMTQPVLDFVWMVGVASPSAAVAVAAFAPSIRTGASIKPPAAVVSVAGRAPIVSNATVVAVPAALIAVAGRAPDQVGRPRTEINAPSAIVVLAASAPVVASQINVIVPAATMAVAGVVPTIYDADALKYIGAVEAADGQALEVSLYAAIDAFVRGCKQDGTWNAIKVCCILAGARTLSGALVPLKGTAPTSYGFVSSDYNRKTGLIGNGTSKYLDGNRANNADPQNNQHLAAYMSSGQVSSIGGIIGNARSNGSYIYDEVSTWFTSRGGGEFFATGTDTSFVGLSRSASGSFVSRKAGTNTTRTQTSGNPDGGNIYVFALNGSSGAYLFSSSRLAFYSAGESLTLSALDSRVSTLLLAIGTAI